MAALLSSVLPVAGARAASITTGVALYHADIVSLGGTMKDGTPWFLEAGRVRGGTIVLPHYSDGLQVCLTLGRPNKETKQCADRPSGQFDASTADLSQFHFTVDGMALRDGPRQRIHVDMSVTVDGDSHLAARPDPPYVSPTVVTGLSMARYRSVHVSGSFRYGKRSWAGEREGILATYEWLFAAAGVDPSNS